MAKAKAKKGSDSKSKAKKDSGAKLSKALRKFTPLKDIVNSDLGREILADALIAAATAAATALTRTRTARKAGAATAEAGSEAAEATRERMRTAAGAISEVVSGAARDFLPSALVAEESKERDEGKAKGGRKPKYVHLASDHSKRKKSRKIAKDEKGDKAAKSH